MEHVDGTNLRALLKQGLLEPRLALDVVRQLCDAPQFAHDEGVVHRDIKPENVLVDSKGRVKVADFGLAKLVGEPAQLTLTSEGQVMGTPHYMAPEQVERPRDVDHRADLFSLGVVFYEMLTGELPLGRFAPPSQRVQVDVRLDEIVLKTLERERERRYQQAAEVKTDVEGVQSTPPGKPPHRRKLLLGVGVFRTEDGSTRTVTEYPKTVWGWLVVLSLFWIACVASFNLGLLGFALISLPLLGLSFFTLVRWHARGERPATAGARWARRLGSVSLLVLGLGALFLAHVSSWERGTNHSFRVRSMESGLVGPSAHDAACRSCRRRDGAGVQGQWGNRGWCCNSSQPRMHRCWAPRGRKSVARQMVQLDRFHHQGVRRNTDGGVDVA
jgi:hypothetical protein